MHVSTSGSLQTFFLFHFPPAGLKLGALQVFCFFLVFPRYFARFSWKCMWNGEAGCHTVTMLGLECKQIQILSAVSLKGSTRPTDWRVLLGVGILRQMAFLVLWQLAWEAAYGGRCSSAPLRIYCWRDLPGDLTGDLTQDASQQRGRNAKLKISEIQNRHQLTCLWLQVLARFPRTFDWLVCKERPCLIQSTDHQVFTVLQLRPYRLQDSKRLRVNMENPSGKSDAQTSILIAISANNPDGICFFFLSREDMFWQMRFYRKKWGTNAFTLQICTRFSASSSFPLQRTPNEPASLYANEV